MTNKFRHYDPHHPLLPYTFASAAPDVLPPGVVPPRHTIAAAPRLGEDGQPLPGEWPVLSVAGDGWDYVEDHRQKKDEHDCIIEASGTPYWLSSDDWQSAPRYMTDIGPLPAGALLTKPEKPQSEMDSDRKWEILAGLADIDTKAARPLRAMLAGTAIDDDRTVVAELEARALALRVELAALGTL